MVKINAAFDRKPPARSYRWALGIAAAFMLFVGCISPNWGTAPEARKSLAVLLPEKLRIVEGFTAFRDLAGDAAPERLDIVLQPLNRFDEPTRVVGGLRIELYELLPASGDARGPRLYQWDISLYEDADQKQYWDRATKFYNLGLVLGDGRIAPGGKYVLEVTYTDPFDSRQSVEHTLHADARSRQTG